MGTDIIRLPDGRTVTMSRARGMGWVNKDGTLTDKAPMSYRDVVEAEKVKRAESWRKRQGLDKPQSGDPAEIAASEVLSGRRKSPKPLVPKNVTSDGEEITDKALLDEIAAKTAIIESRKAAEE